MFNKVMKFKSFLGSEVWRLFVFTGLVGLLWFAVESSFVFVLQGFLRAIGLLDSSKTFLPDFYPDSTIGALAVLLVFGFVRSAVVLSKKYFTKVTKQAFIRTQREKILEYALNNSQDVTSYEVVNVFTERIGQSGTVVSNLAGLFNVTIASTFLFVFGLSLAPYEMLIGLVCLGVTAVPFMFLNRKVRVYGKSYVTESRKLSQILLVSLKNFFLLKLYDQTNKEIDKGKNAARRFESFFNKYNFINAFKSVYPQFSGTVIISVLCFFSLTYFHTPAAKLLSFFYIFMRLSQALGEGSSAFSQLKFNLDNFKSLYHWHEKYENSHLSEKQEKSLVPLKEYDLSPGVYLSVESLKFEYNDSEELFNNLSFRVAQGETLLIKGRSGSGKSTLLTLLLGINKPSSGKVLINGEKATDVSYSLSNNVAYVGPEPYLVTGTVKDNLLYGHFCPEEVSDTQMWKALERAQLIELVESNPKGLARKLQEVTEMSTGQKQRLSIARALLREPKLLVLDEATANLDVETEEKLIDVLQGIKGAMTILIISHKGSFERISDIDLDLETKTVKEARIQRGNYA